MLGSFSFDLATKFNNKTKLVVSHRISSVKTADRILVIKDGIIIEQGKHDELIRLNNYYKKIFDKQIGDKKNNLLC